MSIAERARPEILALRPYAAAVQVEEAVRLNANEMPWSNGSDRHRRPLNRYPEIRPSALRGKLAERFGVPARRLLVTRGSSEAIDLLVRAFCRAGRDSIATLAPSFALYRHYAAIQGAAVRSLAGSPDADFVPDLDAFIDSCDRDTRLVFLCSPNNPTGASLPADFIRAMLHARRGFSAVVVDEAYIEFSRRDSVIGMLEDFDNLVVLRTLSKALAFAGARCGAVLGRRPVIDMLDAIQAPYAMATPVVEDLEDALCERRLAAAARRISEIVAQRERVRNALARLPAVRRVWPSDANFLLVRFADVGAVMEATRAAGILVRCLGEPLTDCIRISIGSPAQNDALLAVLGKLGARRGD